MSELHDALAQLEKEKGIKREIILKAITDALLSAYKRNFGTVHNIKIDFDSKHGFCVIAAKEVAENVTNPKSQISLEKAKETHPDAQIGQMIDLVITPTQFGRIAAQTAKQVITQRIKEAERDLVYEEFKSRAGEMITGVVQKTSKQNILVDLGKVEGVLPAREQSPREKHRVGDRIKAYILDVKMGTKGAQIILSRTYPDLVRKLFEMEVPEIYEHIVKIKGVSREPGFRSKVAVFSEDEKVDSVGSCVGMRGTRVQAIINELSGERIDIIGYSDNPQVFIKNALSPAKASSVEINQETKTALVIVPNDQLSLAIGKEGQNVRLAAKLTNWRIDIRSEAQIAQGKEAQARIKAEAELFAKTECPLPEEKIEKIPEEETKEIPEEKTKEIPSDVQERKYPEQVRASESRKKTKKIPSDVQELPGVGPKLKENLIAAGFVTIKDIASATVASLLAVPGVGKAMADKLHQAAQNKVSEQ